jgi:hypothetical protein
MSEPVQHNQDGSQPTVDNEGLQRELDQLAKQWESHYGSDLDLRLQTGRFLNNHLSSPDLRQFRGEETLKKVSERLQLHTSDLSRMRRFAFHFKSIEDFKFKYPEMMTWKAVKELLPTLSANPAEPMTQRSGNGAQQPRKRKKRKLPKFGALKRSLAALTSDLRKIREDLTDEKKREFRETFQAFVEAVQDCLHVCVSVTEKPLAIVPSANVPSATDGSQVA